MADVLPISGYVLAGGRSSRMGRDKALLKLGGKPLIAHAVGTLRAVCADVHILSANAALGEYAPVVGDLHPDCGPVGGIEAALAHSRRDWNLILAVDIPFLPAAILYRWAAAVTAPGEAARVAMFTVDGRVQPAVCLLHRDIAPSIAAAVALEEFALLPVLEAAAEVFALQQGWQAGQALSSQADPRDFLAESPSVAPSLSASQKTAASLWFLNLNSPEDLALAEGSVSALEA